MSNFLTKAQLAQVALSDKPYFKLWVRNIGGLDKVAYVDTSAQHLMYSPITYQSSWESNLSVVLRIKNVGNVRKPKYHISNIIIPHTFLRITEATQSTNPPLGDPAYVVAFELVANVLDAELFYVTQSGSDPTLLGFHNKDDIHLTPATLAQSNRKNVLATKNSCTAFGVTHISKFDLLGRWVGDDEKNGFKHSTKTTREVIKYVVVKEVEEEEVLDGRRGGCVPYNREEDRNDGPVVKEKPVASEEKPLPQ